MVPARNALGVLSSPPQVDHIPPLKISGIKKRCNAIDGTFYDAIKKIGLLKRARLPNLMVNEADSRSNSAKISAMLFSP